MFISSLIKRVCTKTQCINQSYKKNIDFNKLGAILEVDKNDCGRRFVSGSTHLQVADFSEMPSPRGLPFIGTAFSLILAGGYTRLHEYIDRNHKELGPVFKDNVGPVTAVFLSDAEEMRKVFAKEGK